MVLCAEKKILLTENNVRPNRADSDHVFVYDDRCRPRLKSESTRTSAHVKKVPQDENGETISWSGAVDVHRTPQPYSGMFALEGGVISAEKIFEKEI
jgi:hypothetical protein